MIEPQPVRHAASPRRVTRASSARRIADSALTVAAIGGAVCILAVIAAVVFDITLIMFKTGSMSPTIPAGSLAVVREIPAGEAAVGDIVTIERPDALPITHRITALTDEGDGYSSITMRGDANAEDDPAPYLVSHVRIVLFAIPGLAAAVVAMAHPIVLGGITIGAAALVTWAFWPRDARPARPARRARRARRAGGITTAVALLALVPTVAAPAPAHAAEHETVVAGRYITLRSIADSASMANMIPGRAVPWQVGVSVEAPEPGVVRVGLSAEGSLTAPGALNLEIRACPTRWTAGLCSSGESVWLPEQDATEVAASSSAGNIRELGAMGADNEVWLMIVVVTPTQAALGSEAQLTIHAWGEGDAADRVDIGGRASALASTGASLGSSVTLAAVSVLGGLVLAGAARLFRAKHPRTTRQRSGARRPSRRRVPDISGSTDVRRRERPIRGRKSRLVAAGILLVAIGLVLAHPAPPIDSTLASWQREHLHQSSLTAASLSPVATVSCGAALGLLAVAVPINWTAPTTGLTPTGYRIVWSGSAGSGSLSVGSGATSASIPGGLLSVLGQTVVRVYATNGSWTSPQSLTSVTVTTVAVLTVIVSWTCV